MNRTEFDFKRNIKLPDASMSRNEEIVRSSITTNRMKDKQEKMAKTQELIASNVEQPLNDHRLNNSDDQLYHGGDSSLQIQGTATQIVSYVDQRRDFEGSGLSPDQKTSRQSELNDDRKSQMGLDQAMVELMRLSDLQSNSNYAA